MKFFHSYLDCLIIDPRSTSEETLDLEIPIKTGCNDSNACQCNLFAIEPPKNLIRYVGENKPFVIKIDIKNSGIEPGYGAKMHIQLDKHLPTPESCIYEKISNDGGTVS